MRAIRIHGPEDARFESVPTPEPKADEVLVRVKHVGLCGTDLEIYEGKLFYITSGMTKLPLVPGHEWSGEIAALGSGVTDFAVGDLVTGECSIGCGSCRTCLRGWYHLCEDRKETGVMGKDGGFAEYIAYPRTHLHRCDGLDPLEAAGIEPTAVAVSAVRLARVTPADDVAVFGPGPIGLFLVQVAKACGARTVTLVGTNDVRLDLGKRFGADAVVNVNREDTAAHMKEATGGRMASVVLEAAGRPGVWEGIMQAAAPMARVVLTGVFGGARAEVDLDQLVFRMLTVQGSLSSPNAWPEAVSLHRRGVVRFEPMVTHRLPLEAFVEGIEIMRTRRDGAIKVVFDLDS